jgi:Na+/phosphate symporter
MRVREIGSVLLVAGALGLACDTEHFWYELVLVVIGLALITIGHVLLGEPSDEGDS